MTDKIRLNKFLSTAGVCSRRSADELIAVGRVLVNNQIAEVGQSVNPDDKIKVDKKIITEKPKHYYAFYKPRGIITSMSDEQGEGIGKFFPKDLGLFPVGRLDKESEGLLIATNDGDFANEIIHPSNKKEKVYQLRFASKPTRIGKEGIVRNFVFGIRHHGQIYKAQRVKFIADDLLEISVHEGKNHQLRIIAGKIGLEIKSLKRVAIGELKLSKLKLRPGEIKKIKIEDVL